MICYSCRKLLPDNQLMCRECADKNSRKGYLQLQQTFLPRVIAGNLQLPVVRMGNLRHVQLLGEPSRSYCFMQLNGRRTLHDLSAVTGMENLCTDCAKALEEQVAICQNASV